MASAVVAVVAGLQPQFPAAKVLTSTTAKLETQLPQIRIVGAGGGQNLNLAAERVAVETFAGSDLDAITLAHQVHDFLLFSLRGVIAGTVITKIETVSLPARQNYLNPVVFMQVATYSVSIRPTY